VISSRARLTSIPVLAAGMFAASLPLSLKALAYQEHATAEAIETPFADLGLPEIELQFTAADFTGMQESLEAGRYLVIVHGEPAEEDWAMGPMFVQLPEGVTLDDVLAIDPSTLHGPPDWFYDAYVPGGPNVVASTGETTAYGVIDLLPGEWFVAGGELSQPPVAFTVTGDAPADAPEPEANVTLTIGEMVIEVTDGAFVVGQNIVKVENIGAEPHYVELGKVPDGTAAANVDALIMTFTGGIPEAEPLDENDFTLVGYSGDQSGGTTQWVTMTIAEPGTHVAMCWIPDPETMMPHAAMGMYAMIEIE
jgi:hypothetical protein